MKDINLSFEDVRKMRRGTNTYEVFTFPFMENVKVGIRVLTQDEILRASNIGKEKAKQALTEPDQQEEWGFQLRELLLKAVISFSDDMDSNKQPFFSSAEEVGELTNDETALLIEHYNEVQIKYAPNQLVESEKDFEALVSELKKKPQIGMSLSSFTLRQLVQYLIVSSETSVNDNDSTSTPVSLLEENEKKEPSVEEIKKGINLIQNIS